MAQKQVESPAIVSPSKQVETLKNYIGKEVTIVQSWCGSKLTDTGTLKAVDEFLCIKTEDRSIPFVGPDAAILDIKCGEKVIYHNPYVDEHYGRIDDFGDYYEVVLQSFGEKELVERVRDRVELREDKDNEDLYPLRL
jgi:ferredoxin-fold anticodon binding domain-containing protein